MIHLDVAVGTQNINKGIPAFCKKITTAFYNENGYANVDPRKKYSGPCGSIKDRYRFYCCPDCKIDSD
jgi:hypothetical protein